ncbi:T9SS type A sorting domain-containing protein [Hymenobacter sp. NST-14]|uniref:T9SS type A sorting domain-containing protein n=1 Tax=Hymenobacter piscis TaxID=2839984 RepID=UPI001C02857F|nr:T9SS type A sorting domain-containing protein [Hymenobacter piscis]MBT9393390.1 T9SS type A sorting domain-containing protein [Hymenobacter piscis]
MPTITAVTAARTALTCGDQRPLTLSASASQPGASSFIWTLPRNWTFVPNTATNTATVSVVPSGGDGGQVTVRAYYSCVNYTTPASDVSIGYDPRVAAPTAFTTPTPVNGNVNICANEQPVFRIAAVPGATSYEWTYPAGFMVAGNPGALNPYVTPAPELQLQAPASFLATTGLVRVRALNTGNCQPSDFLTIQLRTGSGGITIKSSDYTRSDSIICPYTSLILGVRSDQQTGTNSNYQWSVSGGAFVSGGTTSPSLELQMPESGFVSVQLQLTNSCDGVKTASWNVPVQQRAVCSPQSIVAGPAYPNPADASLTLEQPAGAPITIYNSQGQVIYKGRAGQRPTRLDTRTWPEGLYYLVPGGPAARRQQLIIKH